MKKIIFLTIFIFFALVSCNKQQTEDVKQQTDNINLQWSKRTSTMFWEEAVNYCKNLNESGHNDWRLPNIDELRTLIRPPHTMSDGSCQLSEKTNKLSDKDWSTGGCSVGSSSKLGDAISLWSSSVPPDNSDNAWIVDFSEAQVTNRLKFLNYDHVRCVREAQPSDLNETILKSVEWTKDEEMLIHEEEIEEEKKVKLQKK